MVELSELERSLLQAPNYASLATLCEDGWPSVSPVWVDLHDGMVLVNTTERRLKTQNARRDPRVAISAYDHSKPEAHMVSVRGRVVELRTEGAADHIDELSRRYTGHDFRGPKDERVILVIEPVRVASY